MVVRFGNIELHIVDDIHKMSQKAAEIISTQIQRKKNSVIGFATGSTPELTYENLINMSKNKLVDFSEIVSFNLDEYYPISQKNDQSYYYFMRSKLFNHVNIKTENTNIPNGETDSPDTECEEYENRIAKAGGIDLQILGIGINGHIGFNEPAESFSGKTCVVDLTEETIEANSRFFSDKSDVPQRALTMGIKTIMMAKKILLIANGEKKAKAIKETLFGKITPSVPSSALQLHQDVTIIIDRAAAKDIISQVSQITQ